MYGASQGSTFKFNPIKPIVGARDVIDRGLAAEEELYGGPGPQIQALPENLAQIDGITEELMGQWSEAKQFADTMWRNYRIDVTKPDVRNPLAVKAAQAFMKATAGIQYGGQKLKDYNARLGETDKAVAEGTGQYVLDPRKQYYDTPEQYFASDRQDPGAQQLNTYMAGTKHDKTQVSKNNEFIKKEIEVLEAQKQEALKRGEYGRAQTLQNDIDQYARASYERPYQLDIDRSGAKKSDPRTLFDEASNIRVGLAKGDMSIIDRLRFSNPNISKIVPIRAGKNPGALIMFKDGTPPRTLNLNDIYGGYDVIMDIMQSNDPSALRATSNQILPWVQGMMKQSGAQIAENKAITARMQSYTEMFKKAFEPGTSNIERGVTITDEQKVEQFNHISGVARNEGLVTRKGTIVTDVIWEEGEDGNYVVKLMAEDEQGEYEYRTLNPKDTQDIRFFNDLMIINSNALADMRSVSADEEANRYKDGVTVIGNQKTVNKGNFNFGGYGNNGTISADPVATVDQFESIYNSKPANKR